MDAVGTTLRGVLLGVLLASYPPGCTPKSATPSPAASAIPGPGGEEEGGAGAITFIENDYARARAEAQSRKLPLFIDAWAPWCHTCLSLRTYVFPDRALSPLADRFVWLALDTERSENAPVVERLGVRVLPTLFVLDPTTEEPRLAHPGSLTAVELLRLLEPFETAAGAVAAPEATADRVARLADSKQLAECVVAGADEVPRMAPGTARADVLRSALACAKDLEPRASERSRLAELVALGERTVGDPAQPILSDDRSDLYDYVVDALVDLGRDAEANRLAYDWVAFLDGEAARAPTPAARAVFDAHRLLAYTAIHDPARAVPMLEQSEHDFPRDYNPPARLGKAFFELKRYDDAIAALERAVGLAYGPRKLRLWALEADVYVAKGEPGNARRALQSALDFAATVPLTGSYPSLRDAIANRLRTGP